MGATQASCAKVTREKLDQAEVRSYQVMNHLLLLHNCIAVCGRKLFLDEEWIGVAAGG